jgi:hypothetical protein
MKTRFVAASAFFTFVGLAAVGLISASALRAAEPAAKAAPSGGEKLVPLEIELPKVLIEGTPEEKAPIKTLEPYSDKPRPPFPAPAGTKNLALSKKVTSSDAVDNLSLITDGDKEGDGNRIVELAPGIQWVQIDLGAAADIYAIVVWHYHAKYRVYHDVVVQVSDDPDFVTGAKTVFNNDFDNTSGLGIGKQLEYIEDYRGRLIDAKDAKGQPAKGRYVRLYSKGNSESDLNHYIEVEVYGK